MEHKNKSIIRDIKHFSRIELRQKMSPNCTNKSITLTSYFACSTLRYQTHTEPASNKHTRAQFIHVNDFIHIIKTAIKVKLCKNSSTESRRVTASTGISLSHEKIKLMIIGIALRLTVMMINTTHVLLITPN